MQKEEESLTVGQERAVLKLIIAALEFEKDPSLKGYGDICRALQLLREESKTYVPFSNTRSRDETKEGRPISVWKDVLGLGKKG